MFAYSIFARRDGVRAGSAGHATARLVAMMLLALAAFVAAFAPSVASAAVPPPTVRAVAPPSGPAAGGAFVIVVYDDFNDAVATAVTFGGKPATILSDVLGLEVFVQAPPGSGTVDVQVTTSAGTSAITPADRYTYVAPTVTITPSFLPPGTVGVPYSQMLGASGGTSPYSYIVSDGALPDGLTLSSGGVLSGTSTAGGDFPFTVTVTDSSAVGAGGPYTGSQSYTLSMGAPTITLAPPVLPDGTQGVAYRQTITASGGTPRYYYSLEAGALPPGFTLDPDGNLSGTSPISGRFAFRIVAYDSSTQSGGGVFFARSRAAIQLVGLGYSGRQTYILTIADAVAVPVSRTWVSGSGDDANPCTRTQPCKTFASAYALTLAGGEINCLDAAGYGTLTITHAVSIVCDGSGAHILVGGTDGIIVNAGASDAVTLSGLDFGGNPAIAPLSGIKLLSAGSLRIANTQLHGFAGGNYAIAIVPTAGTTSVVIDRVTVSASGTATYGELLVSPESGATAKVAIRRSSFVGSASAGVRLDSVGKTGVTIDATIDDSLFSANGTALLAKAPAGTGTIGLTVNRTLFGRNGYAVSLNGAVTALFGDSTIATNVTGLLVQNGAIARSFGDNRLGSNTTNGAFSSSVARR